MFGLENFLDLLLAWLTLFPLSLPLPQISHVPATGKTSVYISFKSRRKIPQENLPCKGKMPQKTGECLTFNMFCCTVNAG
jgi:hypothetical protein